MKISSLQVIDFKFEELMTIELIIDRNCISYNKIIELGTKLSRDFGVKIRRVSVSDMLEKHKELPINIMPAWIVDGELLQIHPMNYEQLKEKIRQRLVINNDGEFCY